MFRLKSGWFWIYGVIASLTVSSNLAMEVFPLSTIGLKQEVGLDDLDCGEFALTQQDPTATVKVLLPFQEQAVRTGFFCRGVSGEITCESHGLTYSFTTTSSHVEIRRQECEEFVGKFRGGHTSGAVIYTPDCALWRSSVKKEKKVEVIRTALEFSPFQNGVKSPLFPGGVCKDRYCVSSDGFTHWFIDEDEKETCDSLRDGFGEFFTIVRLSRVQHLMTTNLFPDVPLSSLCRSTDYCGYPSIVGPDFKGVLLDTKGDVSATKILDEVANCPSGHLLVPINPNRFWSELPREERLAARNRECSQVLEDFSRKGSISDNQLAIFNPPHEGVSSGYRIEGGNLYRYSLLYVYGDVTLGGDKEAGKRFSWKVLDPSGGSHKVSETLCMHSGETEHSMSGPLCKWFNGIQFTNLDMNIPKFKTGLRYIGSPETFNRTNVGKQVEDQDDKGTPVIIWLKTNLIEVVGVGLGLILVFILLWVLERKCCRVNKTNFAPSVGYSEQGGVIIQEVTDSPHRVRTLEYPKRPAIGHQTPLGNRPGPGQRSDQLMLLQTNYTTVCLFR